MTMLVLNNRRWGLSGLGAYDAAELEAKQSELDEAVAQRKQLENELASIEGRPLPNPVAKPVAAPLRVAAPPVAALAPGRQKKLPVVPILIAAVGVYVAVKALK